MSGKAQEEWVQSAEGIRRRILADGEKLMLVNFHFAAGAVGALHSHPHEQATYLISGRGNFTLNGETFEVRPGQSLHIPSNAVHGYTAIEESYIIDAFSPPREDFRK